jgi:hypothetical protein
LGRRPPSPLRRLSRVRIAEPDQTDLVDLEFEPTRRPEQHNRNVAAVALAQLLEGNLKAPPLLPDREGNEKSSEFSFLIDKLLDNAR